MTNAQKVHKYPCTSLLMTTVCEYSSY